MSSSLYSVHKRLPSNHHHAMENRSHDNLNRTGGIPALIDVSDSESDIGGRESPGIMTLGGDVESVRRRPANGTRPATLDEGEPMGSGGVGDPPRERDGRSIENRRPHLANSPAHADASMTAPSPGAYAGGTIAGDHASNTAAPDISGVPLYLGEGVPYPPRLMVSVSTGLAHSPTALATPALLTRKLCECSSRTPVPPTAGSHLIPVATEFRKTTWSAEGMSPLS
ncbi:hypothetical protein CC2G_000007 [Coprinopsis cinerea AmutBmut pab1-1]|nr:hypothetical protein CC2G_006679 [Coprinopsis cinerea AmutBmut pab1-1]KAG2022231.1 hypothetical protein CC2G_000007 [Coprinopsis cinerea AmutBmut pab1-1]